MNDDSIAHLSDQLVAIMARPQKLERRQQLRQITYRNNITQYHIWFLKYSSNRYCLLCHISCCRCCAFVGSIFYNKRSLHCWIFCISITIIPSTLKVCLKIPFGLIIPDSTSNSFPLLTAVVCPMLSWFVHTTGVLIFTQACEG